MSVTHSEDGKTNESLFGLQRYLIRFIVVVTLLLIVVPLLPGLISNLAYSFSGEAPKLYWYLSRSAGFVAFTILWVSMVLGLGITNKLARRWPGAPAAFAIHEFVSLLGLAFAVYHGLVLMGDHFVDFSLPRLLSPFSIEYETFWVGLGQVAFYIWAAVAASFYIRKKIGQKTWRLIHYANFVTYLMGMLHGVFSGTDSDVNWVRWYYVASAGSLLVLLIYRLHDAASKRNFSLAAAIKQHAQDLTQSATQAVTTWKRRALSATEKRIPDALLRDKTPAAHRDETGTPDFEQITGNEETHVAEEDLAPRAVSSPSEVAASPVAEEEAPLPTPVENVEQGSEKNKIKIRIFKEPPGEQVILRPQRDTRIKQVDLDPLVTKLKKFFRTTPIQPEQSETEEKPKRIRILD